MICPHCQSSTKKFGRTSDGRQRYRCLTCRKVTAEAKARLLPGRRVPDDRTLMVLQLLCEGASVRAVERLTGTEKRTVLRLLRQAGEGCERMMATVVKDVKVQDVECDEIWSYVRCKEATKKRKGIEDIEAGDCYCFTALERNSKLLLAFQVGRRSTYDAHDFMAKVGSATAGEFQISTDGWSGYPETIEYHLGDRVNYEADGDEPGGAVELDHPHPSPENDSPEQRLQPQAGQPPGEPCALLCLLQLRQDPPEYPVHPGHGCRDRSGALVHGGPAEGGDLLEFQQEGRSMGSRKVYPVWCYNGQDLTVMVDGNRVPMEEFLQTHTPIQVTSLSPFNSNEPLWTMGLMIAEENRGKEIEATWGR